MFEEIIAPLLTTEWGRRSGVAAIIIFSLFLLTTLIKIPITWHNDYVAAHRQTTTKTLQPFSDQDMALILKLPEQHIFGTSINLPITSLQLHLIGIIQADTEDASSVIISEAGQPGKIYQIGDSLSSGVHIKSITANGVILENGGHMENLPLSRPPLTFQKMPKNSLLGE